MNTKTIKETVKERYGKVAKTAGSGGGCCCGGDNQGAEAMSKAIGYSDMEMGAVPEGANLGLGCGNPTALASLKPGETVVDLGSGAGFDAFLAANEVGPKGRVIGVDMTPEMLEKARTNAEKGGYSNVEFRQGDIEAIPVEDGTVDAIISNCVINLALDKKKVFAEAARILKPGGRLMVSDIVLLAPLPQAIRDSAAAYAACIAGALLKEDYIDAIRSAGFEEVEIISENTYPLDIAATDPLIKELAEENEVLTDEQITQAASTIVSLKVHARKKS